MEVALADSTKIVSVVSSSPRIGTGHFDQYKHRYTHTHTQRDYICLAICTVSCHAARPNVHAVCPASSSSSCLALENVKCPLRICHIIILIFLLNNHIYTHTHTDTQTETDTHARTRALCAWEVFGHFVRRFRWNSLRPAAGSGQCFTWRQQQ